MPGKTTYSAGTAFITVVPSFLGIENAFKQQVRDMAAAADKDLAAGMAKGLDDINKQAKDRGSKAGRDYAGAYESEARKALTKAWQSLPEPKPDVDLSPWERALGKVRQDMKELSAQRIGVDIDRATFDQAIDDFRKRLEQLRDSASGPNKQVRFFDADEAAKELKAFQDFTDEVERRAGTAGEQAGSAFGQRLSKSLADAIGKTPDIKVGADTSEAERSLAELRARMEDLQSKRIGIDIDAGSAYAEIKAIKEALDGLDRRTVRADIRTNARAAAAELGQITTAAEGAAQSTEGIGGSADFSLSRLEALILLGASLGTVLVPAAAAAAGAIGTIGSMAIGAGTGIGVFALAISGVSAAVKALNTYQNATAKSTKSFDDANRSVASSTDQVRSAEQALANTRRTAAQAAQDAARRVTEAQKGVAAAERDVGDARRQAAIDNADAARQVRDAQAALTDAEQNALDVRKALTQAIEDAKNSMAELDVQLKRNQQDQSVAVTAQMQALEALNKLRTNPRATEIELRQAEDAYNEQTVRIEELQVKHKELADQQAKYAKDGVEADNEVIAARKRIADADKAVGAAREKLAREQQQEQQTEYKSQQRIADAQDRVAKAQDQVAQARQAQARQAQDAQYQLAQASQAVTAAQRAQQAAWEKTAVAGGSALDTLNAKMSQLSPAQQHFAKFIFGLKDDLVQLQAAAAEPLLPQLETAISGLLKYLPGVEAFVSKVAAGLGNIAIQSVNAFGSTVWQKFFGFVNQTAVPSLQNMYTIGQNLAQGLIDIFLALTPFNQDVGSGLIKLSQDFAVWAEKLDKTQGYRDFLAYVQENGPKVVHFLGQVGELFINIVKSSAGLGSVTLHLLTDFVGVLNSLPEGVLSFLVTTIGLLSLGFSGLGAVMRVIKFKDQIVDIFGPRAQKLIQQFAIDTGRATDETGRFGKAVATVQGIAAAGRDKVVSYATAVAGLPGKTKDAITSSSLFSRSIDAVKGGASAVSGAVKAMGDTVQNVGPRMVSLTTNAKTAATGGLDRLKNSMLDVVAAASGPGGISAGVQTAGGKLAGLASSAADAGSKLGGKLSSGASTFASALGTMSVKAKDAAGSITSKLMKAGSGLLGMLGGPWGIALTGATLALGYFADKSAEQKAKVDTLKAALGELTTTYRDLALTGDQASAAADQAFANIVKQNPELQKAVIELDRLGVSFTDMVQAAASGDPAAVVKKLNDEIARNQQLSREFESANFHKTTDDPYRKQAKNLEALRDAFVQNAAAMGQANQATEILNANSDRNRAITALQAQATGGAVGPQIDLLNAYDKNAASIDALNKLIGTYSNLQSTAQQRADAVRAAIENQTSAAMSQSEADEALAQKTMALRDQVNQAKDAHDKNARSLDLNSQTALRNRDAIEEVAKQIREMYLQDIAAGKPIADVTKAHDNRIAALKEEAKHLGLDKTATQQLIDTYGNVPKDVKTTVTMDKNSFDAVYRDLQRAQFMQMELRLGKDPSSAEKDWQEFQREQNRAIRFAEGGKITGPGGPTSDKVLMWGSDGEFVHKAAAVNYYGTDTMAAINNMQIPREQIAPRRAEGGPVTYQPVPAYAKGGSVTWPYPVNVSKTWIPTKDWLQANTPGINLGDGSWSGTLSPNQTAAKMQQFALAQRGKRYLWAAVGPNSYDCSGLTGDLWAIATGHSLYHRYMSTSDMGAGRHGMVAGPGKYWTVYLGPGHTASNIAGLHAEAYGGNGTPLAIGRIGTRLSYYTQKLHLPGFAEGGMVDPGNLITKQDRLLSFLRFGWPEPPPGSGIDSLIGSQLAASQFDGGGMLPPGYSTVVNNTGSPEPVLTSQQWNDISAIAAGGRGRGGNTYQFSFLDTTLNEQKLREIQDREAITARYDRAR